jgi:hypothetical protein
MRTACWLNVLLCATCAACSDAPKRAVQQDASQQATVRPASAVVVSSRTEKGRTRLELQLGDGRRATVLLARDSTVSPEAETSGVDVVAAVPGAAIVVVDRYGSSPAGLSLCQAGEEQFLHVVAVAAGKAAETFVTKVASCRDNIELAEPGLVWDASLSTLRIHWLTGPAGQPEVRAIRIGADGRTQAAP